jgi:hypothetical protein
MALPETVVAFAYHGTGNANQTEPEQHLRWNPYVVENRACLQFLSNDSQANRSGSCGTMSDRQVAPTEEGRVCCILPLLIAKNIFAFGPPYPLARSTATMQTSSSNCCREVKRQTSSTTAGKSCSTGRADRRWRLEIKAFRPNSLPSSESAS